MGTSVMTHGEGILSTNPIRIKFSHIPHSMITPLPDTEAKNRPTNGSYHYLAIILSCYHHIYIYIPIGSMYGIYGNIYHQYIPNVSIYTIHGSYGIYIYSVYIYIYSIYIYIFTLYMYTSPNYPNIGIPRSHRGASKWTTMAAFVVPMVACRSSTASTWCRRVSHGIPAQDATPRKATPQRKATPWCAKVLTNVVKNPWFLC